MVVFAIGSSEATGTLRAARVARRWPRGRGRSGAVLAVFAQLILAAAGLAGPAAAEPATVSHIVPLDDGARKVAAPSAFLDACTRYAWLCNLTGSGRLTDPDEQLRIAKGVNLRINLATTQVSDPENYGVPEYWTLPRWARGDCEDFVLAKYRQLLDAGFDSRDLAVAIVLNRRGDNHAVLVLHHSSGDLVLDNLSASVQRWDETGYRFLAMQARENKRSWLVAAPVGQATGLIARN